MQAVGDQVIGLDPQHLRVQKGSLGTIASSARGTCWFPERVAMTPGSRNLINYDLMQKAKTWAKNRLSYNTSHGLGAVVT